MITELIIKAKDVINGTIIQKKSNLCFIALENQWISFIPKKADAHYNDKFKIVIDDKFILLYEDNKLKNSWLNYQKEHMA